MKKLSDLPAGCSSFERIRERVLPEIPAERKENHSDGYQFRY